MTVLNAISFFGIFGLCLIAWVFSENRRPRYFPWRVVIMGILLQLVLGALVFLFPPTRDALDAFSKGLDSVFAAAERGARFVFGDQMVPKVYGENPPLGYIFAFRALPTVVFFSGLMALLYNIGVIQVITNVFAKVFYSVMRLSGAEALSGAANIFVGIEAAIVVKPYLPKMTRSEICAILACCFGTSASSTLAIYVSFLRPAFPNILAHLVSASIMAIPACFVISKILVPETEIPVTARGLPKEEKRVKLRTPANKRELMEDAERSFPSREIPTTDEDEEIARLLRGEAPLSSSPRSVREREEPEEFVAQDTVAGEPMERMSPMDAAIGGAIDGVKMAVAIAAVLILILGFVSLIDQFFNLLAIIPGPIGNLFKVITLQNILGFLFVPVTFLTGVSLDQTELWQSSVIIGRRLFETAIPPYLSLASASAAGQLSDRAVVIISYALSGFAHLASVGIFVGGMIALIPSRRKDISDLGWKALFVGTLATIMIGCVAGVFYTPGNAGSILGDKQAAPPTSPAPSPSPATSVSPQAAPGTPAPPVASPAPSPSAVQPPAAPPAPPTPPAPAPSPTATPQSSVQPGQEGQPVAIEEPLPASDQQSYSEATYDSET